MEGILPAIIVRITIKPSIAAPLPSTDYFGDRDPAMEAMLADS